MATCTPATVWWAEAVRAACRGEAVPPVPAPLRDAVAEFAARHRLEPLLAGWGVSEGGAPAYWHAVARGETALREGLRLWQALEDAGVPALPMRGPFAGHRWYGDAGRRWFTDVDVLVPRPLLDRARAVSADLGYTRRQPRVPYAFYRAVHLHYPLQLRARSLLLDLHWAVDHPFAAQRIDFPSLFATSSVVDIRGLRWRVASPAREALLQVAHLHKECGACPDDPSAAWALAAQSGQLLGLLDLALQVQGVAAQDWGLGDTWAGWLNAARQPVPWAELPRPARAPSRLEALGGFRWQRLAEARAYLRPPPGVPGRWRHRVRAAWHLGSAGLVAVGCLAAGRVRPMEKNP